MHGRFGDEGRHSLDILGAPSSIREAFYSLAFWPTEGRVTPILTPRWRRFKLHAYLERRFDQPLRSSDVSPNFLLPPLTFAVRQTRLPFPVVNQFTVPMSTATLADERNVRRHAFR